MAKGAILAVLIVALSIGGRHLLSQDGPQDRADYSGVWGPIEPSATGNLQISQDAAEIRIQQRFAGSDSLFVVPLDGSEGVSESPQWTHRSRGIWIHDGALIVMTETTDLTRENNSGAWSAVYTFDWETQNLNVTTFKTAGVYIPEGAPQYTNVDTASYARTD